MSREPRVCAWEFMKRMCENPEGIGLIEWLSRYKDDPTDIVRDKFVPTRMGVVLSYEAYGTNLFSIEDLLRRDKEKILSLSFERKVSGSRVVLETIYGR